jgi:uncharacterized RmlC-like cupin family protein
MAASSEPKWRHDGVRVVHSNELDINTPQTPGMNRAAAITHCSVSIIFGILGSISLQATTPTCRPAARTCARRAATTT